MVLQRSNVRAKVHEIHAAIAVDMLGRRQILLELVEVGRVALGVGHADELAGRIERPAVIEAGKATGVAAVLAADQRAAVQAAVDQDADLAVAAADEDERTPGDGAAVVVARLRQLGIMTDVEPATVEY